MDQFTLDQLRAILEARKLTESFVVQTPSRIEKRAINGYAKTIANIGLPLGKFESVIAGRSPAGPIDPLPDISSGEIYREIRGRQKSIYGEDDRVEAIASTDPRRRVLSRSVAAIIPLDRLVALDDGKVSIGGTSLADRHIAIGKPLCGREAFLDQPSAAVGTAFLVSPTLVATAYHCLGEDNATNHCLIFDFETDAAGLAPTAFAQEQIYGVKKFHDGTFSQKGADWSLVELDRSVEGRPPLVLSATKAKDNSPLYVIGHPSGLPKKIAGNAEIRVNTAASHFVANLDTFGGNSGSPVFNAVTHEVEAILVRGDADFVPLGDCYASLICPISGCRGEDCSRVAPVASALSKMMN